MSQFARRPHVRRLQIRKRPIPQPARQEIATNFAIEQDGPVTALIRDRRAARGAIDPASAEALTEALLAFDADGSQSVAVPWGAGGAFCAGFDLKYAAGLTGERRLRSRRRDRAARRSETPHQCAVAERRVAVRWATSQCQIADTHPISSITRANTRSIAGVRSPP
jgi:hypothetical protein